MKKSLDDEEKKFISFTLRAALSRPLIFISFDFTEYFKYPPFEFI